MSSSLFSHSFSPPKSRKGMEIAINTLVVMILGILIVGGGMVLVAKISSGGAGIADEISKDQERGLAALLNEGQLVAAYPSAQTVPAGETRTYAIGVFTPGAAENFTITVASGDINPSQWKVNYLPKLATKPGKSATALITVMPTRSVPKGEYTFIVTVKYDDATADTYDSPRFFTVKVQ